MDILIAEDDRTVRTMITAVLSEIGCAAVETANGDEAWRVLQQPDAPRLAVLDWVMPELNGLEVLNRVRAQSAERLCYIIMLMGKPAKADIIAGLKAGADAFLVKPLDPGELHAHVVRGQRMVELQDMPGGMNTRPGLRTICTQCKKIKDDAGNWHPLHGYQNHLAAGVFSHGLCPPCMQALYPEYCADRKDLLARGN